MSRGFADRADGVVDAFLRYQASDHGPVLTHTWSGRVTGKILRGVRHRPQPVARQIHLVHIATLLMGEGGDDIERVEIADVADLPSRKLAEVATRGITEEVVVQDLGEDDIVPAVVKDEAAGERRVRDQVGRLGPDHHVEPRLVEGSGRRPLSDDIPVTIEEGDESATALSALLHIEAVTDDQ